MRQCTWVEMRITSLIAILVLGFGDEVRGSTGQNDLLSLHEYRIEERGAPCGNTAQIASNGFVIVDDLRTYQFEGQTVTGPQLLDILALRNPTSRREWRKTGELFTAWKPNTAGTVNVWRVYMPFACSHVFVAEGEKISVNGQLVDALSWARTQPANVFQVDEPNGGVSFAAKLPILTEVNGVKNASCPSGTRPLWRVYNGGFNRATTPEVPMSYRFNDGNHRYFTNWRKLDETLSLAGWEIPAANRVNNRPVLDNDSNPETGMLCLPAEVKSLWTTQAYAADMSIVDNAFVGTFYSQFDLAQGSRRDIFGVRGSRTLWTDTSLQEVLSPGATFHTTIAKTAIAQTAQVPLGRLTAIPHERSNTIVHVGDESNPQMIWGYNRTTGAVDVNWVPSLPQGEQGVQALQVGDWLWVASCVSGCDGTAIRLYDQRSKARIYEQVLPFRTAQANGVFSARPSMSFSPEERALYVASRHTGKLYRVHLPTRNVVEMLIPQGVGVAYGATDVKVDTLNKQVLVVARTTRGKGKLVSYLYGSSSAQYTVDVGGSPWALDLGAYGGSVHAFVTNNYDDYPGGEATDTVSIVDVVNRVHVRKLPSAEQPTGLALVF